MRTAHGSLVTSSLVRETTETVEIGVCKIDTQNYKDVGFIKVDVEGNEYEVLLGAVDTVDKYKPTCMIECYPKFSTHPCEMIYNFFVERGSDGI